MPTAINKTPRNASDHWPATCGINSAMMPIAISRAPVTRVRNKLYNDGISAGRGLSGSVQLYPKVRCSSEYPLHLTCIKRREHFFGHGYYISLNTLESFP